MPTHAIVDPFLCHADRTLRTFNSEKGALAFLERAEKQNTDSWGGCEVVTIEEATREYNYRPRRKA